MRPQRLEQGEKRARRVLKVWRACQRKSAQQWERDRLKEGGLEFQVLRFTRARCSCSGCGNPRRHWGERTRQEVQADDAMRAEMEDVQRGPDLLDSQRMRYWYDTPYQRYPLGRRKA
jgi:hypothetical protein